MEASTQPRPTFSWICCASCSLIFLVPFAWALAQLGLKMHGRSLVMEWLLLMLYVPSWTLVWLFKLEGALALMLGVAQAFAYSTFLGWHSRQWRRWAAW